MAVDKLGKKVQVMGPNLFFSRTNRQVKLTLSLGCFISPLIDAYYFLHTLFNARGETERALEGSLDILSKLNETIPSNIEPNDIMVMVKDIQGRINGRVDEFLSMTEVGIYHPSYSLMKFYSQAAQLAFYGRKKIMMSFLICKIITLTIENGLCKYSATAMAYFSSVIVTKKYFHQAYKFGKISLRMLNRFSDPSQLPPLYLCYHGLVSFLFEPMSLIAEQHRRGFDVGMSIG